MDEQQPIDERAEALAMETEIVSNHQLLRQITFQQITLAHNRSMDYTENGDSDRALDEGWLIEHLLDHLSSME